MDHNNTDVNSKDSQDHDSLKAQYDSSTDLSDEDMVFSQSDDDRGALLDDFTIKNNDSNNGSTSLNNNNAAIADEYKSFNSTIPILNDLNNLDGSLKNNNYHNNTDVNSKDSQDHDSLKAQYDSSTDLSDEVMMFSQSDEDRGSLRDESTIKNHDSNNGSTSLSYNNEAIVEYKPVSSTISTIKDLNNLDGSLKKINIRGSFGINKDARTNKAYFFEKPISNKNPEKKSVNRLLKRFEKTNNFLLNIPKNNRPEFDGYNNSRLNTNKRSTLSEFNNRYISDQFNTADEPVASYETLPFNDFDDSLDYNNDQSIFTEPYIHIKIWECTYCSFINKETYNTCTCCSRYRQYAGVLKLPTWKCNNCQKNNTDNNLICDECQTKYSKNNNENGLLHCSAYVKYYMAPEKDEQIVYTMANKNWKCINCDSSSNPNISTCTFCKTNKSKSDTDFVPIKSSNSTNMQKLPAPSKPKACQYPNIKAMLENVTKEDLNNKLQQNINIIKPIVLKKILETNNMMLESVTKEDLVNKLKQNINIIKPNVLKGLLQKKNTMLGDKPPKMTAVTSTVNYYTNFAVTTTPVTTIKLPSPVIVDVPDTNKRQYDNVTKEGLENKLKRNINIKPIFIKTPLEINNMFLRDTPLKINKLTPAITSTATSHLNWTVTTTAVTTNELPPPDVIHVSDTDKTKFHNVTKEGQENKLEQNINIIKPNVLQRLLETNSTTLENVTKKDLKNKLKQNINIIKPNDLKRLETNNMLLGVTPLKINKITPAITTTAASYSNWTVTATAVTTNKLPPPDVIHVSDTDKREFHNVTKEDLKNQLKQNINIIKPNVLKRLLETNNVLLGNTHLTINKITPAITSTATSYSNWMVTTTAVTTNELTPPDVPDTDKRKFHNVTKEGLENKLKRNINIKPIFIKTPLEINNMLLGDPPLKMNKITPAITSTATTYSNWMVTTTAVTNNELPPPDVVHVPDTDKIKFDNLTKKGLENKLEQNINIIKPGVLKRLLETNNMTSGEKPPKMSKTIPAITSSEPDTTNELHPPDVYVSGNDERKFEE